MKKTKQIQYVYPEPTQVSEVMIGYKNHIPTDKRLKISSSDDAWVVFAPFFVPFMEHHEEMYAALLNNANEVLAVIKVGQGDLTATVSSVRAVAQAGILLNASGVILAHNHPSGKSTPSDTDKRLTRKVNEGLALLDMKLIDHIILTPGRHYSMANNADM